MSSRRSLPFLGLREVGDPGPAVAPRPPGRGLAGAALAVARLGPDLLIALDHVVREAPHLVQDVRSIVNDLARILHQADPESLGDVLQGLGRAAGPDGELTHLLGSSGDLAQARAEREDAQLEARG